MNEKSRITEKVKSLSRKNKLSQGTKSGIVFTIASLLSKGLVFVTIPIFTRLMTAEEIGVVNLYNSWFMIISVISTLSLTSGGYQLALKEFSEERDKYESSILTITSLVAITLSIIYCFFHNICKEFMDLPESLIVLMLIGFLVNPAFDFWLSRQRFEYKYRASAIISILIALVSSILSICAVLYMNKNGYKDTAIGRLWGSNAVIYGFSFIIWLYIVMKGKTFYNKKYWRFSLSISVPLMGHALAKQILDVSDRQMISKMVGNREVGIYGTLYSVSSISVIIWNAINTSYIPYLYKNIDNEEEKNNIKESSFTLLCVYTIFIVLIIFLAPEIVTIFATSEYYEAISIVPTIALGVSLTAISNMYSNILIYYKKSKYIMIASFSAAISNVGLNYLFIRIYGYKAAAYTTLASFIVLSIILSVIATRVYKDTTGSRNMIYKNSKIFQLFLLTAMFGVISLFIYDSRVLRICILVIIELLFVIYIKKKLKV